MTIIARYPARCATCQGSISPGQSIEWAKGSLARHTSCAPTARPVSPQRRGSGRRARGTWTGCACGSVEEYARPGDCSSCRHDRD